LAFAAWPEACWCGRQSGRQDPAGNVILDLEEIKDLPSKAIDPNRLAELEADEGK
jgi:hypothetical protein